MQIAPLNPLQAESLWRRAGIKYGRFDLIIINQLKKSLQNVITHPSKQVNAGWPVPKNTLCDLLKPLHTVLHKQSIMYRMGFNTPTLNLHRAALCAVTSFALLSRKIPGEWDSVTAQFEIESDSVNMVCLFRTNYGRKVRMCLFFPQVEEINSSVEYFPRSL